MIHSYFFTFCNFSSIIQQVCKMQEYLLHLPCIFLLETPEGSSLLPIHRSTFVFQIHHSHPTYEEIIFLICFCCKQVIPDPKSSTPALLEIQVRPLTPFLTSAADTVFWNTTQSKSTNHYGHSILNSFNRLVSRCHNFIHSISFSFNNMI